MVCNIEGFKFLSGFLCHYQFDNVGTMCTVYCALCDMWYWIGVYFVLEVCVFMTFPLAGEDVPWGLHHNSFLPLHSSYHLIFEDKSDVILGSTI